MTALRNLLVGSALALAALTQQPASPKATLDKLDAASRNFTSATADFKKDLFTRAVNDDEIQNGSTYVIRRNGASEVGIRIEGKEGRTVQYKDGTVKIYNPGTNCVNTFSADKNKATADSFLGLSFGTSGKELQANWVVTDLGPDTISADGKSIPVEKLDLVPRDATVKKNFTHVALWIDTSNTVAYKQIFYTPTLDTQTATYFNVKLGANAKPDKNAFAVKGSACK